MIDQKSLLNLRKLSDFIFINLAFIISAFFAQPIQEFFSNKMLFILLILQNILWFITASISSIYTEAAYQTFSDQVIKLIKIIIVETLFSVLFLFFIKENLFTRNFVFYFATLLLLLLVVKEYVIWKSVDRQRSLGQNLRNLVIVGINEVSLQFREEIKGRRDYGFNFIGFVDKKNENGTNEEYLGNIELLDKIITDNSINDIVYSASLDDTESLKEVRRVADKLVVKLTLLPQIKQFSNSNIEINFLGNFPVLSFRSNRFEQFQWRFLKRSFDLVVSILALIGILWFVYLIIAIFIKISSHGKVLFNQDRIGKNENVFICYKFRTMKSAANDSKYELQNDSARVTRVGKFLRKYSLDELPQFVNVLLGDMSIVGPRPHAVVYNNIYKDMVDEIKLRHRVKPGITGWAQVHGLRGDVFDFEENRLRTKKRIDFDNWYIENWSLKLDIQIMIETVWQIISGRNLGT